MRIYGVPDNEVRALALYIGCDFQLTAYENRPRSGPLTVGRPVPGPGVRTPSGRLKEPPKYARRQADKYNWRTGEAKRGRRIHALCFHGLRDFIRLQFEVGGATRVKSAAGDWRSLGEFEDDLPRLAHASLNGPGGYSTDDEWIERCDCVERELGYAS